ELHWANAAPPCRQTGAPSVVAPSFAHSSSRNRAWFERSRAALLSGDIDRFRGAFLPEIQAKITPATFAACRAYIAHKTLRPDWDVAEEHARNGRREVRVSIFGKSLTAFVETSSGEWKADALWCVPPVP